MPMLHVNNIATTITLKSGSRGSGLQSLHVMLKFAANYEKKQQGYICDVQWKDREEINI